MDRDRVHYYSQYDMTVGWSLQQIEALLMNFDASTFVKDINDVLELYHIKKHIDHDNHLPTWKEDYIDSLKLMVKSFPEIIVRYLRAVPKDVLYDYYKLIDWDYKKTFWELVADYKILDLLDESFWTRCLPKIGTCV